MRIYSHSIVVIIFLSTFSTVARAENGHNATTRNTVQCEVFLAKQSQIKATTQEFLEKSSPAYREALVKRIVEGRDFYEAPFAMINKSNRKGFSVKQDFKANRSYLLLDEKPATEESTTSFLKELLRDQAKADFIHFYLQQVPADLVEALSSLELDSYDLETVVYGLPNAPTEPQMKDVVAIVKKHLNTFSYEDFLLRSRLQRIFLNQVLNVVPDSVDIFKNQLVRAVRFGVNINLAVDDGGRYSHIAQYLIEMTENVEGVEKMKLLINAGLDPNLITNDSWLLLQAIHSYEVIQQLKSDTAPILSIIKTLLANSKLDLTVKDENGNFAYLAAIESDKFAEIKKLILSEMTARGLQIP